MERWVILDRDGVINQDSSAYVKSAQEWLPLPGSIAAIARLKRAGYGVVVATNQSGLARGLFTEQALAAMHNKMTDLLASEGVAIDGIYFCPHHPDDDCSCRKPKAGLLLAAAKDFPIDWSNCILVGDSLRDLQAAQVVGATPVLVRTGKGEATLAKAEGLAGIAVYDDLASFVDQLLLDAI
jgi:D-glycero-D-manno-heptose 1,7-bisphosphate phosphatase